MKRSRLSTAAVVLVLIAAMVAGCATNNTATGDRSRRDTGNQALLDHIQLGLGYIGKGKRESARFHLLKALDIDSRSPGANNGIALLYQMEQEYALAEEHYKKALAYDSGFTRARNNYGVFLYQRERYNEAYDQFTRAAADINYDLRPQVFLSLGLTADRLDQVEEARKHWRKAVALAPRLAPAYLELAESYFKAGEYPQAQAVLKRYDQLSKPTARSLWLGVRLEHRFGNRDASDSKGLALKNLFPYSRENLEYQRWLKDERR